MLNGLLDLMIWICFVMIECLVLCLVLNYLDGCLGGGGIVLFVFFGGLVLVVLVWGVGIVGGGVSLGRFLSLDLLLR